nr:MAG TPA: hypothetical protein [Caudoviricetes sp.]
MQQFIQKKCFFLTKVLDKGAKMHYALYARVHYCTKSLTGGEKK